MRKNSKCFNNKHFTIVIMHLLVIFGENTPYSIILSTCFDILETEEDKGN